MPYYNIALSAYQGLARYGGPAGANHLWLSGATDPAGRQTHIALTAPTPAHRASPELSPHPAPELSGRPNRSTEGGAGWTRQIPARV